MHGETADREASPDGVMAWIVELRDFAGCWRRPFLRDPPHRGPPVILRVGARAIRDGV